jgi:VanZ family protein
MSSLLNIFYRWVPAIAWMALIFFLSSRSALPGPTGVAPNFLWHKIGHLTVYSILYFLMYRAVNFPIMKKSKKNWILPMVLTVLYAATDEFHQSFVPGRTPAFHDIGYDALGASIALLAIYGII